MKDMQKPDSVDANDLPNWQQPAHVYAKSTFVKSGHLISLVAILKDRKDKRYRDGLLQGAVSFGVISHEEWADIRKDVDAWIAKQG